MLSLGKTVVVCTIRQQINFNGNNKEDELRLSVTIPDAITGIVAHIEARSNFIVSKGGITSSDIGVKG